MTDFALLTGLFWSAFLAATVLPGASELVLIAALTEGEVDPVAAVLVAGLANTLGSVVNWAMGRYFSAYADRRWFPVPRPALAKAEAMFKRYGVWTLLLAWWPFGGDALTLAAGFLRVPILTFTLLVGAGKFARYAVVAATTLGLSG
ncbi:YqaA family protein [Fulvimarina sp. 2208YS6-2-32]|uniref:YqaA family protein n=1 Tax=Fulvimarina uroteuthidis TaxID=3098149 RepID=A0ABU5I180_9HYPH|nr:YqaA family protein [Fulvimarina sp. 2208YS6-2-32]MDY8109085.1 YqaA family protein [Fulvimarina sp. 2208YS6-2-32]